MADQTQSRRASKAVGACVLRRCCCRCLIGCEHLATRHPMCAQAWHPEALAPPAADRTLAAARAAERRYRAPADAWQRGAPALPSRDATYDLPALVDLALRDNPRHAHRLGSRARRRGALRPLAWRRSTRRVDAPGR